MIERVIRYAAILLSLIVALGFVLFAIDEAGSASKGQREKLAGYERADPSPAGERERERRNSKAREVVDDANDALLKPFAGVVSSDDSRWMQRGIPALLGLLVYGVLLGFLARFMRGHG